MEELNLLPRSWKEFIHTDKEIKNVSIRTGKKTIKISMVDISLNFFLVRGDE
jgi:hypothetical protein